MGTAEVDAQEADEGGTAGEREEEGAELPDDPGEAAILAAARAAIPPANRQVLDFEAEQEGVTHEDVEFGQRDAAGRFASLTRVFAVSFSPLATRWFLIRMRSSFSENVMRV